MPVWGLRSGRGAMIAARCCICHSHFWLAEGAGAGAVVVKLIASCELRLLVKARAGHAQTCRRPPSSTRSPGGPGAGGTARGCWSAGGRPARWCSAAGCPPRRHRRPLRQTQRRVRPPRCRGCSCCSPSHKELHAGSKTSQRGRGLEALPTTFCCRQPIVAPRHRHRQRAERSTRAKPRTRRDAHCGACNEAILLALRRASHSAAAPGPQRLRRAAAGADGRAAVQAVQGAGLHHGRCRLRRAAPRQGDIRHGQRGQVVAGAVRAPLNRPAAAAGPERPLADCSR